MTIKTIDWNSLTARLAKGSDRWHQGEHVSIIGPTGAGKTYLGLRLLPLHPYTIIFGAKAVDSTLTSYAKEEGYTVIPRWPPNDWDDRSVIWPKYKQPGDENKQRAIFAEAINAIFAERNRTLFIDEVSYFKNRLKLESYLLALWEQGRSLKLSFLAATQRPKGVPLQMYDMPHHLFFFRFGDENDLKRIGGIGYLESKNIRNTVARLERYEFLYIHTPTGSMFRSKVEENT